jgi:hypothetical protein
LPAWDAVPPMNTLRAFIDRFQNIIQDILAGMPRRSEISLVTIGLSSRRR